MVNLSHTQPVELLEKPFKISLKQSAKGFWYVDKVSVSGDGLHTTLEFLRDAVSEVEVVLNKLNVGRSP